MFRLRGLIRIELLLKSKYMADQLVVMNKGKTGEIGDADAIYEPPNPNTHKIN